MEFIILIYSIYLFCWGFIFMLRYFSFSFAYFKLKAPLNSVLISGELSYQSTACPMIIITQIFNFLFSYSFPSDSWRYLLSYTLLYDNFKYLNLELPYQPFMKNLIWTRKPFLFSFLIEFNSEFFRTSQYFSHSRLIFIMLFKSIALTFCSSSPLNKIMHSSQEIDAV